MRDVLDTGDLLQDGRLADSSRSGHDDPHSSSHVLRGDVRLHPPPYRVSRLFCVKYDPEVPAVGETQTDGGVVGHRWAKTGEVVDL